VIDNDAPDPTIVSDGTTYFAFTTDVSDGQSWVNVPTYHSSTLSTWSYDGDALPALGQWATAGLTWSPSVVRAGAQWVLYYTAHETKSGQQCIGIATATQPSGPYSDARSTPFVCQSNQGGSIDPSAFVDSNGNRFLVWKSDNNAIGGTPIIWSQRLSADGQTLTGNATQLLINDRSWEGGLIEGPSLIKAAGQYWLFYSAGWWSSWDYSVGFATCAGPLGPCTKQTTSGPWMSSTNASAAGPGGASFSTTPGGTVVMAFHGWRRDVGYENGGYRATFVEPIDFSAGSPMWRPDWSRTGGPAAVPAPVLSSSSAGSLDVFAAVGNGPLWIRRDDGNTWTDWGSLGGGLFAAPAAASSGPGRNDVFVHGLDHALWHRSWNGSTWSEWESLGGGLIASPAAVSRAPGTLDVFVQGLDHALWHRAWNGASWSGWESLAGGMIGSPAVVSAASGGLDVFVQGLDHAVWHRAWNGVSWSGWGAIGGQMIGGPAVASTAAGTMEVFVHGTDHALWHMAWNGSSWSGWGSLGGGITSDPSAASAGPGSLTVAAGGLDGDAWTRSSNGASWSPWAKLLPP
jgi:hypothetical protein